MAKKNDLEVILELHKKDVEFNVTSLEHASVAISTHIHSARTVKQGGLIEMGVDPMLVDDLLNNQEWGFVLVAFRRDRFTEAKYS